MAERLQKTNVGADTKQTTTATHASAIPKDEKHDENIVVKTAHSIRDKVHGLTANVKEKAQNLKHNDHSKK